MMKTQNHSTFPKFTLVEELITLEGISTLTYGMKRGDEEFRDIWTDKEQVMALIDFLNRKNDIETCHVWEAVEDFLGIVSRGLSYKEMIL